MIVVGVDHSESATDALRFAFEEARLRRTTLCAVHAWQFGYIGASGIEGSVPVVGAERGEHRRAAEAALDAAITEAIPDADDVEVQHRVLEGTAARTSTLEKPGLAVLMIENEFKRATAALSKFLE